MIPNDPNPFSAVERLDRDLRIAARTMGDATARCLVDAYYSIQKERKRFGNQIRALKESGEPTALPEWFFAQTSTLEGQCKAALEKYCEEHIVGVWLMGIHGIGPVLTGGLLAHIDIRKAKSPSSVWRFAGLDPTITWEKGQKRPYNAKLKELCWKIGDSFKKHSGNPKCYYGHLYRQIKAEMVEKNERGEFAAVAKAKLANGAKSGEGEYARKLWEQGKLTAGHLDLRAMRKTVKIFLCHLWLEWYRREYGEEPPKPWIIQHGGHVHFIPPPPVEV